MARYDLRRQPEVEDGVIDVTNTPEHDPWSRRGSWDDY